MNNIDKLLDKTKGNLFFQKGSGFLGSLLFSLDFKWNKDIDTVRTNGIVIEWNPDFFESLDEKTRITVLAHELWHVAYLHAVRIGNRDPKIWNIAADHVINLMLESHNYYMDGFPYYMDSKYKDWSTEDVYNDLIKNPPTLNSSNGTLANDLDYSSKPDKNDVISKVIAAASTAKLTNSVGDIPSEISTTLDKFLNPKLPWDRILFQFFNDLNQPERSYRRFNRRYDDPLLPGESPTSGLEHIIFYLDISGSVTDEQIDRFNSEVRSIRQELEPELLTLVTFDTEIHDVYVFQKDDPFEKLVITGRGGTDFQCIMDHAVYHKPTAIVIFTDLGVNYIPNNPNLPVVWVCIDNETKTVPYGKLIHFNEETGFKFS